MTAIACSGPRTGPSSRSDTCAEPVTDGYLCTGCTRRLRSHLSSIVDQWPDLEITITRQDRLGPQQERAVRRTIQQAQIGDMEDFREAARLLATVQPINMGAAHRARQAHADLRRWSAEVADLVAEEPANQTVSALAGFIAAHLPRFRLIPTAGELARDVRRLDYRITTTIDLPENRTTFFVGPCPLQAPEATREQPCPCPGSLYASIPQDDSKRPLVDCVVCGASWQSWQWHRLGRLVLARARTIAAQQPAEQHHAAPQQQHRLTAYTNPRRSP